MDNERRLDNQLEEKIMTLNEMIKNSRNIVFFGGAGVSTESGIPDFRSADGLYTQNYGMVSPEEILSRTFFDKNTEDFYRFYYDKMLYPDAQPNTAHKKLAELEAAGKNVTVVTQNIDGLHQLAGSGNVLELHGSVHRNRCRVCNEFYNLDYILQQKGMVPRCECGGLIKPEVVLYEESLDAEVIEKSVEAIAEADLLIIAGTSLTVYPAAGFVRYFRGRYKVVCNLGDTAAETRADLYIKAKVGEVLGRIRLD